MSQQAARTQVACNGQIISEIVIRSHAPTYGGLFERSVWLGHLVTSMHVATAPSVIRNFVLLKEGAPCTSLLRRETERVLRAQPYLANAAVAAFEDGPGRVRVEITTVDEPSVIASLGVTRANPYVRALTFGNANVQGKGIYAVASWREGFFYRDTWLLSYNNYQLFRRPYQLLLRAARDDHGYSLASSVGRPFFTELQAFAWHLMGGAEEDLVPFRSLGRPTISLGIRREYFDAGAGFRVGGTGHLGLVGASVSTERASPSSGPLLVTDTGIVVDTTTALIDRYTPYRSTRLNLLGGFRVVNFLRVTGFDALGGTQDMRRGFQVGVTLGRGLRHVGSTRDETFLAGDIYGGVGSTKTFAGLQIRGEGRRIPDPGEWSSLLYSGRFAMYLRPHRRHTIEGDAEFAAGARQQLPFQLSLGDTRGGVRGYHGADLGGARRVVFRLEDRWHTGTIRGTGDAGVAIFTDVGRLWAGDVPLGTTTPYEPSVGIGLLGALPPGSKRLWRLDLAVPLRRGTGARWEARITSADRTRTFYIEPNDVRLNHERTLPASVFTWP
jgi:hypothetical protein